MLPLICTHCQKTQANNPQINGIYHGRDYETPCPICGNDGIPATIGHLLIPCEFTEAHPSFLGGPTPLGMSQSHKIACGYGPRIPRHLTSSPNAATCYHCLKVYRQSISPPDNSESLET